MRSAPSSTSRPGPRRTLACALMGVAAALLTVRDWVVLGHRLPLGAAGAFFQHEFLVQQSGRWFAQYPPVHAAALALGTLAGAPWLVNPLLGALAALFIYLAARRAYDRSTAGLALVLCCASPFVWF